MNSSTDEELVRSHLSGDQKAFQKLYDRYRVRLQLFCLKLLQDSSQAEDIVQLTFTKAFQRMTSLDSPRLFYYWLFTIARNEVYGFLRQSRRNGTMHLEEENVFDERTPHEEFIEGESRDLIMNSIDELKLEYREVLVLRQFEKLSYNEIAAITGHSLSAIESRLFKARKALAKKLAPFFEERKQP